MSLNNWIIFWGAYMDLNSEEDGEYLKTERESTGTYNIGFSLKKP